MIPLTAGPISEIAVVGAHCDDIAIGMGGTLLTLAGANVGLRVRALVLCGAGSDREVEERAALAAFCPDSDLTVVIEDLPDGRTPAHWGRVKEVVRAFRSSCEPQLVFGPQRRDAHQDHRLLAELLPTEFRDHLTFGYEILKWESDTISPAVLQPLSTEVARLKARLLDQHYPSQRVHDWFDEESFLGLSRLRGVQCRSPHAEGFVLEKAIIDLAATSVRSA